MIKFLLIFLIYICVITYSLTVKQFLFKSSINNIVASDLGYGFSFLIIIAFLVNILLPLNSLIFPLIFISFFLFLYNFSFFKKHFKFEIFLIILILTLLIEINPLAGDTPFYHLQIIKWYSDNSLVFGIANLENRFGIVSGWHHLLSIFNHEIFKINLLYLLNSIPLIILIKLTYEEALTDINKIHQIFLLSVTSFLLVYSFIHPSLNGTIFNSIGSADADSSGMYFYILSFYFFLKSLNTRNINNLALTVVFSVLSYISKLSYLPSLMLPIFLVFYLKINILKYLKFMVFIGIINFLWVSKYLVSTGCLIFPLDFTCINFEWSVSKDLVKEFAKETSAFARSKNNTYTNYTNYDYYLNSFQWFLPWVKNFFFTIAFIKISIFIIFLSSIIIFFNLKWSQIKKTIIEVLFLFIFFVIGLTYWLIAPDIRFGYALFICITVLILSISVYFIREIINKINISKYFVISIFLVLIGLKNIKYQFNDDIYIKNRTFNYSNLYLHKKINNYEIYKTNSGDCAFFKKICIYNSIENLEITRKGRYIFIKK